MIYFKCFRFCVALDRLSWNLYLQLLNKEEVIYISFEIIYYCKKLQHRVKIPINYMKGFHVNSYCWYVNSYKWFSAYGLSLLIIENIIYVFQCSIFYCVLVVDLERGLTFICIFTIEILKPLFELISLS